MAKITLNTILSSFASTSLFNTNFSAIQTELNNKVLYRNNPMGEANEMLNDLDMNSNDILNAGDIATATITVGGVDLTAQVAAAATSAANAATSEANAATSETNAAASAAAAAASETNTQAIADAIEGNAVFTDTEFTSSAGVDTFAVTYIPGRVYVLLNGVNLAAADFTATNGTQVILATPLASNSDILTVRTYTGFGIADALAITSNLSDVASVPTARNNLGIFSGNKNLIINGDFSVWQRGTSQTSSGYGSDDRFSNEHVGSSKTVTRETWPLGDADNINNNKYFSRTTVTSSAGAGNYVVKSHKIESVISTANRDITVSFRAKADAAKNIALEFVQNFGTGGSPSAAVTGINVTTFALTTSWQTFTVTIRPPSIAGKVLGTNNNDSFNLNFWYDAGTNLDARTNSLGQQSGTFDIANVQLEFGDTATDFEYVSPTDQLARCQRYYQKSYPQSLAPYTATTAGMRIDRSPTTTGTINIPLVTNMRSVPNISLINPVTSANNSWRDFNAGTDKSVTFANASENHFYVDATATVAGNVYGGHWVADAEL